MYRTYHFVIKKKSELFNYLEDMCMKSKNLWNVANFYIRQNMTGLQKPEEERQPNEVEVINKTIEGLRIMNNRRISSAREKFLKNCSGLSITEIAAIYGEFENQEPSLPSSDNWFLDYIDLNNILRCTNNPDYRALPAQVNGEIIKKCCASWKSYFAALREYKRNSSSFAGKPKTPGYRKKRYYVVAFTNQACRVHMNGNGKQYIKFPVTTSKLWLGKLNLEGLKLQFLEAQMDHGNVVLHVVFDDGKELPEVQEFSKDRDSSRIAAIDIGENNLAAITDNTGGRPLIVKGRILKSYNQWANKETSRLKSIANKQGILSTKKIDNIWSKRNRRINDYFHKAAKKIIQELVNRNIDTLVVGQNKGWKQSCGLGKKNNQNFVQIPFTKFINMLKYLCEWNGIKFIAREESYTSKASFLDMDCIPSFGEEEKIVFSGKIRFSGKRISRGLYKTGNRIINADINASFNILRKEFPDAIQEVRYYTPVVL